MMASKHESVEQPKRSRRFRFSILTILFVTTIVGLSLAYFRSRGELLDAQAKLTEIRRAYDPLEIDDPKKIHVRRLNVPAENMWQWRVYLPEGDRYRLKFDYNSVPPKTPKPTTRSNITLSPGMYVVTQMFLFEPGSTAPVWKFHLAATGPYGDVRASGFVPREEASWLETDELSTGGDVLLPPTEAGKPRQKVRIKVEPGFDIGLPVSPYTLIENESDQQFQLLRFEVDEPLNPVGQEPVDYLPLEVFRLWIERVTPPKVSANVMPCPLVRNDRLGDYLRQAIHSNGSHQP